MKVTAQENKREIRITRTLKAPVEKVWKIWTQPQHIAKSWGPTGFTNTIHRTSKCGYSFPVEGQRDH